MDMIGVIKIKYRMFILVLFVLSILFFSGCSTPVGNEAKMGNTNANIANGGASVLHDDWIYFRYKMQETVKARDISVTVNSAYSTNIIENNEPSFESHIYDVVIDGMILFVKITISNDSDNEIDLNEMTGVIEDINRI